MYKLFISLLLLIPQYIYSQDLKILSYNLGTSIFKSHKKSIKKLARVINYYDSDVNIFQNSFNRSTNMLLLNSEQPYYTFIGDKKKKVGNKITSKFPIIHEKYNRFSKIYGLWKSYGISFTRIKLLEREISIFNITMPKSKKTRWSYILDIEKKIKRSSYDHLFILAIEFDKIPNNDHLSYLKERLNLTDITDRFIMENNLNKNLYKTGMHKKKPARTNYLFIGNSPQSMKIINVHPVFDGRHDENRYLKDAGILFHLDI